MRGTFHLALVLRLFGKQSNGTQRESKATKAAKAKQSKQSEQIKIYVRSGGGFTRKRVYTSVSIKLEKPHTREKI